METAEQLKSGPTFEERYYEALRRQALATGVGRVALDATLHGELELLRQRRYDEVSSALAEGLKPESLRTAINTHYVFELEGGKLIAGDGETFEDMLVRGFRQDMSLANQDSFYAAFLPQRSRFELDELREQEAMARGETEFNTIVTFSPYSEEYAGTEAGREKLVAAAQKPYWQRSMLRVTHWDGQKAHLLTRSIDNTSLELLKETAIRELGYEFSAQDSTAMLGERLKFDIKDSSWMDIANKITERTDSILSEKHGGRFKQGNPEHSSRDAQAYVETQTEIIEGLLNQDKMLAASCESYGQYKEIFENKILYDCIALLETRLEKGKTHEAIVDYAVASSGAGSLARAEGKSYDMCGSIVGPKESQEPSTAQKTGFESLKRLESKKITCPDCNKKVVVASKYLEKGQLYCSECGLGVDVCTGESFRKNPNRIRTQQPDILEPFRAWWRKVKDEEQTKKENIKLEAA